VPGTLNKAELVASKETFEALGNFQEFMLTSVTALTQLRLIVDHLQRQIREHQGSISNLSQYGLFLQDRLRSTPPENPAAGMIDAAALKVQADLNTARERLAGLTAENVQATEKLGRAVLQTSLDAGVEVGKLNFRIRQELDLPLDEEWYLARLNDRLKKHQAQIDGIYRGVDRIFAEAEQDRPANAAPPAVS